MAVDGVIEDMTHIILNLKNALLRKLPTDGEIGSREPKVITTMLDVTAAMLDKHRGQYPVTLKDLAGNSDFDVVNPDLVVFNVTKPMVRKVELKVAIGRGYVPSERHQFDKGKGVDEVLIDSA